MITLSAQIVLASFLSQGKKDKVVTSGKTGYFLCIPSLHAHFLTWTFAFHVRYFYPHMLSYGFSHGLLNVQFSSGFQQRSLTVLRLTVLANQEETLEEKCPCPSAPVV